MRIVFGVKHVGLHSMVYVFPNLQTEDMRYHLKRLVFEDIHRRGYIRRSHTLVHAVYVSSVLVKQILDSICTYTRQLGKLAYEVLCPIITATIPSVDCNLN